MLKYKFSFSMQVTWYLPIIKVLKKKELLNISRSSCSISFIQSGQFRFFHYLAK